MNKILNETQNKINQIFILFFNQYNNNLVNKIHLSIINNIKIINNKKKIKLHSISSILIENNNIILIKLTDIKLMSIVYNQISKLNFNILIQNDTIKVIFPNITKEYKKKIIKILKEKSENNKINIRNIRREFCKQIKYSLNNKKISKDENKKYIEQINKIVKDNINKIDQFVIKKKKELIFKL